MNAEQAIAFAVLGVTLVVFVWGRWRYDLVAVCALIAVTLAGLVPAGEAFAGFAHPAVITVAAVLVISRALRNAGVVDLAVRLLAPLRGRPTVQLAAQSSIIALLSAFMNNVGAMALMLPVALRNAYRDGYAPALVLMPLAFASLLGGLTTLIGTPPNIIIATFRAEHAGVPFAMFDYSPVGLVVALAGLVFVSLIGWRLIPLDRRGQSDPAKLFEIDNYVAEAEVVQGTEAVGQSIQELEALAENDVTIAGLFRGERRNLVPSGYERVRADDVLVLEGDPTALTSLIEAAKLKLVSSDKPLGEDLRSDDVGLAEAVILPGSSILARSARAARLRTIHRVNLLALARHGTEIHQRLSNVRFQVGDVLLLQGATETLPETLQQLGCLPLAGRGLSIGAPQRLVFAGGIFALAIAATLVGLLPVHVAFVTAAAVLVLTQVISLGEVYEAIDWPIIVLLGAMIPVGSALEATGGAALIANTIVQATAGLSPAWVLAALFIATMFISDVINNNATAVLMAPIAIELAERLSVAVDPFLMATALGASCAFLTPIGHQSNTLVMAPGGYRFGDYWRMGLPLEAVIAAVGIPMVLWIWPL